MLIILWKSAFFCYRLSKASQSEEIQPFEVIGGYRVIKTIGHGGFGDIYLVRDEVSNTPHAMKIERPLAHHTLQVEHSVLQQIQGSLSFPKLYSSGTYESRFYIIMDLLGPSLSRVKSIRPGKKLSLSTVLRAGIEMICVLREFHTRGFVHRDVSPNNFLIRPNSPSPLCLIDFGLAKRYIDPLTGEPHKPSEIASFFGTIRYASLNAHRRIDLAPADDLIAWFYSMIELVKGELPWGPVTDKELVLRMKETISAEDLCRDLPSQFVTLYHHLQTLKYEDTPDYDFIVLQLSNAMKENQISYDEPYDWANLTKSEQAAINVLNVRRRSEVVEFEPPVPPPAACNVHEGPVEKIYLLDEDREHSKDKCSCGLWWKKLFSCFY